MKELPKLEVLVKTNTLKEIIEEYKTKDGIIGVVIPMRITKLRLSKDDAKKKKASVAQQVKSL